MKKTKSIPLLQRVGRTPLAWNVYNFLYQHLKPQGDYLVQIAKGFKMYVNPHQDEALAPFLIMDGIYEKGVTALFEKAIKKGMTVVDVGANIGYHTLLAAKLVSENGLVYAFEPDPRNFDLLKRNVELNHLENVKCVQKAVFNNEEKVKLSISSESATHRASSASNNKDSVLVDAISLDVFFKSIDQVNFVKVDVEGGEMAVLQGMTKVLEKNPNLMMVTEFWPAGLRESGFKPEQYLSKLLKCGFKVQRIDENGQLENLIDIAQAVDMCGETGYINIFCNKQRSI